MPKPNKAQKPPPQALFVVVALAEPPAEWRFITSDKDGPRRWWITVKAPHVDECLAALDRVGIAGIAKPVTFRPGKIARRIARHIACDARREPPGRSMNDPGPRWPVTVGLATAGPERTNQETTPPPCP